MPQWKNSLKIFAKIYFFSATFNNIIRNLKCICTLTRHAATWIVCDYHTYGTALMVVEKGELCPIWLWLWANNRRTNSSTIDQTELSRTFFNISTSSSNFQGESTSVFYKQLCCRIFNYGLQKYVGRKMLKFGGQISEFVRKIFWQAHR